MRHSSGFNFYSYDFIYSSNHFQTGITSICLQLSIGTILSSPKVTITMRFNERKLPNRNSRTGSNTYWKVYQGRNPLLGVSLCGDTSTTSSPLATFCCCFGSLSFANSSWIFLSIAASSDFKPFSSSSFFHCLFAISWRSRMSLAKTAFVSLYCSMVCGMRSSEFFDKRQSRADEVSGSGY